MKARLIGALPRHYDTPQLRDLVQKLEASSGSAKLCGLILRDGDLTLALNTRYVFAGVPEELDLRDIDGIRKWFIASLTGMGNLLDLIQGQLTLIPVNIDVVNRLPYLDQPLKIGMMRIVGDRY